MIYLVFLFVRGIKLFFFWMLFSRCKDNNFLLLNFRMFIFLNFDLLEKRLLIRIFFILDKVVFI